MSAVMELAQGQQRVTCTIGPVSLPGVLLVDGDAWLTRKEMAALFEVADQTVDHHVDRVKSKNKPGMASRKLLVPINAGRAGVRNAEVEHFNTKFVCHVGYGINGERGEEFRDWVTEVLHRDTVPESIQRALETVISKQLATVVRSELAPVVENVQKLQADIATLRQSSQVSVEKLDALEAKSKAQQNALVDLQADMAMVRAGHITSKELAELRNGVTEAVNFACVLQPQIERSRHWGRLYRELRERTAWDSKFELLPTTQMPLARKTIERWRRDRQAAIKKNGSARQGDLFKKGAA